MRLFIWPGTVPLAQELPSRTNQDDGLIRSAASNAGPGFGMWCGLNLLDDDIDVENEAIRDQPGLAAAARQAGAGGGRLVTWSGWIAAQEEDERELAELRTHGQEGHRLLHEFVERAAPVLEREHARLVLRPAARHVLSDVPSCLMFLRSPAAQEVRLVLDPIGLLTESMLDRAEDHLERILSALAEHPGVAAVLIANGEVEEMEGERRVRHVGLHRGTVGRAGAPVIDPRRLIAMFSQHARADIDWIMVDEGVGEQQEMLRMYGPVV